MRRLLLLVCISAPGLLVLVGATALGATHPDHALTGASAMRTDALVDRGEQLYLVSCSSCHGVDGRGTTQGPGLRGVGAAAADFQLTTGRMPLADPEGQPERKPPAFRPEQIDALVAYVASLGPGPPIPKVDVGKGDLSAGGTLYRANCAACHSATGAGGALSAGLVAPSLHESTATQVGEAMRTGPGQMPVFGPATFSAQQVDSIARYVGYLQDPADPGGFPLGGVGPITEGMVALLLGIPFLLFVSVRIEESHERRR
jgi:ubiquinol-cytochrome c reductase cytochrome c subunit